MSDEAVFFPPYQTFELREVLRPRLKRAFREGALPTDVTTYGAVAWPFGNWGAERRRFVAAQLSLRTHAPLRHVGDRRYWWHGIRDGLWPGVSSGRLPLTAGSGGRNTVVSVGGVRPPSLRSPGAVARGTHGSPTYSRCVASVELALGGARRRSGRSYGRAARRAASWSGSPATAGRTLARQP